MTTEQAGHHTKATRIDAATPVIDTVSATSAAAATVSVATEPRPRTAGRHAEDATIDAAPSNDATATTCPLGNAGEVCAVPASIRMNALDTTLPLAQAITTPIP